MLHEKNENKETRTIISLHVTYGLVLLTVV